MNCPTCKAPMTLVTTRDGSWWGCGECYETILVETAGGAGLNLMLLALWSMAVLAFAVYFVMR
jgi:hypothetical protein